MQLVYEAIDEIKDSTVSGGSRWRKAMAFTLSTYEEREYLNFAPMIVILDGHGNCTTKVQMRKRLSRRISKNNLIRATIRELDKVDSESPL